MAGGTAEAPAWLTNPPAGHELPASGEGAWPHMQENYGAVSVGQPPAGLSPAGGSWPAQQENYGGVSIAPCADDPTGPDGL